MRLFKNSAGNVFGYDDDQQHLIDELDDTWTEVTDTWHPTHAEPTTDQLAEIVRRERDARLSATDWTQLQDVPKAVSVKWKSYRQALRDLTQQTGFPSAIDWPVAP